MRILRKSAPRLEYRNKFMAVNHTRADFDGFSKDYFVVDLRPRAGVVAVREGKILLTRQYRFLIDNLSWELPGGMIEPGETAEQAACRECLEETGVLCKALRPLIVYYPGLDNFDNRTTLLYAEDVEIERPFKADPREIVELAWRPLGHCLDMAYAGEILDGLTIMGLLAYDRLRGAHRRDPNVGPLLSRL